MCGLGTRGGRPPGHGTPEAGDWSGIFTEPIAVAVYVVIAVLLVAPFLGRLVGRRTGTAVPELTREKENA